MSATNTDALLNAVERILIPNIVLFFIGWLMGAVKVLPPPAVFVLNMTALYWIFPCAVFSGFLNFQFTGFDFFFFLFNIIAKFVMVIPAIVPYMFYKINLRMVCTLWLTAVYNDAITYALYYLSVFYTEPRMMTWISLSTVPSNIIFFPIIVFMMEYHDYKKNLAKSVTGLSDTSTYKIVLSIILRVIKNPLVWAGVSGIVLNQAVLGPGGKFPIWFTEIFILSRACTMPINMFLLGVFTSTYGPIHNNVMKILCFLVKPIKDRLCPTPDEAVAATPDNYQPQTTTTVAAGNVSNSSSSSSSSSSKVNPDAVLHAAGPEEKEVPKPPVWGEKLSKHAEEGRHLHGVGMWGKEGSTAEGVDAEMEEEIEDEAGEAEKEKELERRESKQQKPSVYVPPPAPVVIAPAPPAAPPAAAAPTAAAGGAPPAAGAKQSDDYKFNFWLLLVEIVIRHVISPAVMLVLCLIFRPLLTQIQMHCMVVMTSFGTGGPVFVLGRQYNAYPGEAAVTQVVGAFILNVVFFIIFYYICQAIWPL